MHNVLWVQEAEAMLAGCQEVWRLREEHVSGVRQIALGRAGELPECQGDSGRDQDTHKLTDLPSLTATEREECMVQTNRCSTHVVDEENTAISHYCRTCEVFVCQYCLEDDGDHKEHETRAILVGLLID